MTEQEQWIENQAKALADYASLKYKGLHSEAHDHVRLYAEDCLREAMDRITNHNREKVVEAVEYVSLNGLVKTENVLIAINKALGGE